MKVRWTEIYDELASIDQYIVEQAEKIMVSNEVNIAMWPIKTDVNKDGSFTFDEAISSIRTAYNNRMQIVGDFISNL